MERFFPSAQGWNDSVLNLHLRRLIRCNFHLRCYSVQNRQPINRGSALESVYEPSGRGFARGPLDGDYRSHSLDDVNEDMIYLRGQGSSHSPA